MRIELERTETAEDALQTVLDLNSYHQGLLAEISGATGSGANPSQASGLYYLLELQSALITAAIEKQAAAGKPRAA